MDNNLNLEILKSDVEIDKINNDINDKIFNFITKANEFVELSEDDYQIEKTLMLNKISLKGYVLDSDLCNKLADNNITDYSIDELKNYLSQYKKFDSSLFLALSLYELILNIEKQVDSKIELEIKELSNIIQNISDINNTDKTNYKNLYYNFKNQV